jgi:hypothetical protein
MQEMDWQHTAGKATRCRLEFTGSFHFAALVSTILGMRGKGMRSGVRKARANGRECEKTVKNFFGVTS